MLPLGLGASERRGAASKAAFFLVNQRPERVSSQWIKKSLFSIFNLKNHTYDVCYRNLHTVIAYKPDRIVGKRG